MSCVEHDLLAEADGFRSTSRGLIQWDQTVPGCCAERVPQVSRPLQVSRCVNLHAMPHRRAHSCTVIAAAESSSELVIRGRGERHMPIRNSHGLAPIR